MKQAAWIIATVGLAALASAGGCSQNAVIEGGPIYPDIKQGEVLDIQVVRDETVIRMTNTTARAIPACRMWINRWYSRELGGMEIGQTLELELDEFRDKYGETFRAGGFFAPERADWLVQAQLEVDGQMKGLVVVTPPVE